MTASIPEPDAGRAWGRSISDAFRPLHVLAGRLGDVGEGIENTTKKRPGLEAADLSAIPKGNKAKMPGVAKLRTTTQLAEELSITTEQVRRLVQDGDLHGINVGRQGAKRQSMRFSDEDVADFKARRRTTSCLPSTKTRSRNSTKQSSGSTVVSFLAQQRERASAKHKPKPTGSK